MSHYRTGWPDLLLILAYAPVLTGHFYVGAAMVAAWAALYCYYVKRRPR